MRAKAILNLALGLFVLLAVAVIAWQARPGGSPAPSAPVVAARVITPPSPPPSAPERTEAAEAAPIETTTIESPAPPSAEVRAPVKRANVAKAPKPVAKQPAAPAPTPASPSHKVIAMYFHGDVRCATCRKVEAYAKEAVEAGFAEQVAAGLVEFRAVNVDRDENRHFIQDYQLTNKSVVVTDEVSGKVERWVKLDNVWGLVGNHDAYLLYVQDAVRAYVEN